jgi:hypothetical protein
MILLRIILLLYILQIFLGKIPDILIIFLGEISDILTIFLYKIPDILTIFLHKISDILTIFELDRAENLGMKHAGTRRAVDVYIVFLYLTAEVERVAQLEINERSHGIRVILSGITVLAEVVP